MLEAIFEPRFYGEGRLHNWSLSLQLSLQRGMRQALPAAAGRGQAAAWPEGTWRHSARADKGPGPTGVWLRNQAGWAQAEACRQAGQPFDPLRFFIQLLTQDTPAFADPFTFIICAICFCTTIGAGSFNNHSASHPSNTFRLLIITDAAPGSTI